MMSRAETRSVVTCGNFSPLPQTASAARSATTAMPTIHAMRLRFFFIGR